jgi:hypothetical protein
MNKVDLYVNGFRLDLFDDEEITINLSVQNVQDISKVFTDFTQGFTVFLQAHATTRYFSTTTTPISRVLGHHHRDGW